MAVASALRPLRTAAIARLEAALTLLPAGAIYTGQVPQGAEFPYLFIGGYDERPAGHYGQGGSDSGFDIRGSVRVAPPSTGDAAMLALYGEVYAALHEHPLTPEGHQPTLGNVRLVTTFRDPDDASVLHFVARYEALTAVAA